MPLDPPRFAGMLRMPDHVLCIQLSCSLQCICAPPPFVNPGSAAQARIDWRLSVAKGFDSLLVTIASKPKVRLNFV